MGAMSERRKLVQRTPLSTRHFARRSWTCFSWKPILRTFRVSPGGEESLAGVGGGENGGRKRERGTASARVELD